MSQIFLSFTLLLNIPNFYNLQYRSILMKCIRYIWCNFLYNITFSLFRLSQGSVATLIRWGERSLYHHMYHSSLNLTVKTALKSLDFSRSYTDKNTLAPFLWLTVYVWVTRQVFLTGKYFYIDVTLHARMAKLTILNFKQSIWNCRKIWDVWNLQNI